jgi:hypothetical protein
MQRILVGLTALIVALAAPQSSGITAQGKTELRGRIVCRTCYSENKANTGIEHEGVPWERNDDMPEYCARVCARKGLPVAIVTEDGKMYTITGALAAVGEVRDQYGRPIVDSEGKKRDEPHPNAALATHFGHTVNIIGAVGQKDGVLEIAGDSLNWNMDTKDWRVGSTAETKHTVVDGEAKGVLIEK